MKYFLSMVFFCLALQPLMAQEEPPPVEETEPKPRQIIDRSKRMSPPVSRNEEVIKKDSVKIEPGFLNIVINTDVDVLVRKNRFVQQNKKRVDGWRIQIIQATDKTRVLTMRSEVSNTFPQYETYLDYKQPYFKLRIGNFTERFEAYRAHKEVSAEFSRAFLVRERIPMTKIKW